MPTTTKRPSARSSKLAGDRRAGTGRQWANHHRPRRRSSRCRLASSNRRRRSGVAASRGRARSSKSDAFAESLGSTGRAGACSEGAATVRTRGPRWTFARESCQGDDGQLNLRDSGKATLLAHSPPVRELFRSRHQATIAVWCPSQRRQGDPPALRRRRLPAAAAVPERA